MMNSAQFRVDVEALGGINPATRLQRLLNDMAEQARQEASRYYRSVGGQFVPWARADPLPLPLLTPGTHEVLADGTEIVDGRTISGAYP
jgi:hypothetical protein